MWTRADGWNATASAHPTAPDVVLVFGAREALSSSAALSQLGAFFPSERIFGCSTAGEIEAEHVRDDTIVATAMWFGSSSVKTGSMTIAEGMTSRQLGETLAKTISHEGLVHAFVLSDGTNVNGSDLVAGLTSMLPARVGLTGGLSGDGAAMKTTVVCSAGVVATRTACIIGFYGDVRVGMGSLGGWQAFGPERAVTKSSGNVLSELDGGNALSLYKKYLGDHAAGLPSSALLFPLLVRLSKDADPVVRTILAVDEASGTMTFAGDVPQGASAQLMRANFDRIIGGAFDAARSSSTDDKAELAILISCVGRKLILKQRVEEEVEAVREVLGPQATLTGFYSYGELAPFTAGARCQLHNQTMTVTTFAEKKAA